MKKIFITLLIALALPLSTFASSTSFAPATVNITTGQSFSVSIVINPQETDYTAKVALSYPADLLSVTSFSFASGWLPLSQPGYDSIDNASGLMVKTAGFSGGFSGSKVFGTVTFMAKAAGSATIVPTNGTQILDASNANSFTSGGRGNIIITQPVVVPVQPVLVPKPGTNPANPARKPLAKTKTATSTASTTSASIVVEAPLATDTEATSTKVATAVLGFHTEEIAFGLGALAILVAFFLGTLVGKRQNRIS